MILSTAQIYLLIAGVVYSFLSACIASFLNWNRDTKEPWYMSIVWWLGCFIGWPVIAILFLTGQIGTLIFVPILFTAFLGGCASVPDKPLCVNEFANEQHPDRLYCNYTLSQKPFYVDDIPNSGNIYTDAEGKTWTRTQLIMISLVMPPETWGSLDGFIQKVCHENPGRCGNTGQWDTLNSQVTERIKANMLRMP